MVLDYKSNGTTYGELTGGSIGREIGRFEPNVDRDGTKGGGKCNGVDEPLINKNSHGRA